MLHGRLLPIVLIVLVSSGAQAQTVLYVDDDAPPGGDGTSWNTAYRFLQDAVTDASGGGISEVRVGQGTYQPDRDELNPLGTGNREATFQLINGVALMGGYAGFGAPDPDARDIELYETILSGDLNGDDGRDFLNNDENAFHVVRGFTLDPSTVLDGLVIVAGNANGPGHEYGGGFWNQDGSPMIVACTFTQNAANLQGSGMHSTGNPTIEGSSFIGNILTPQRSTVSNRGIGLYSVGKAVVQYCLFENNKFVCPFNPVTGCDFFQLRGGGMYSSGDASISHCTFSGNILAGMGNAMGGGLYMFGGVATDCSLLGNFSGQGGGAFVWAATLIGCLFNGNSSWFSSGVSCSALATGESTFIQCRFVYNDPPAGTTRAVRVLSTVVTVFSNCEFIGDGLRKTYQGLAIVRNCTFFGGGLSISSFGTQGDIDVGNSILWNTLISEPSEGTLTVNYCCSNSWAGGGTGNINADPLFVDSAGGDLHLLPGSPCIDAGDNSAIHACSVDLDRKLRFADDPATSDTGSGEAPIVDMGAYEFGSTLADDDCNLNGIIDRLDILIGASFDCDFNCIPDECDLADDPSLDADGSGVLDECEARGDFNGDGCVDAFDLGAMLGAWCSGVNDPNPPSPPCENCTPANLALADISGAANVPDGCVDAFDLAKLLGNWCSVAGGNPCGTCLP
ncbi:MAG: hypothetical protein IH830_00075 [Planctomycetes bacterium]|nr:hypothetical protein [Planctomycetota bacterium]